MAPYEVAFIRRAIEAFEAEGFEAWLTGFVAPDCVWIQDESVRVVDSPRTYHGWEGWREGLTDWTDIFDEWEFVPGDVLDAGGSDVLVIWSERGRGKGSGLVSTRGPSAFLHTVSQGKIVRTVQFGTAERAYELTDLSPRPSASLANVEIIRTIYDAVARRDVRTPFELYAEDIVWDISRRRAAQFLTTTVAHGHEGVREVWREGLAAFGQVDFDVVELVEAGDQVLAVIREREVGRASGVPVETIHYAVWTLRDGKVSELRVFDDREEAFAAAGLHE